MKPTKSGNDLLDSFFEQKLEEWNEKFSDVYKFFKIEYYGNNGWQLQVAEHYSHGTMILYDVYTSYVGYRKQDYSYMYDWIPDEETCIDEAYDFWVTDSKSQYIDFYAKGNNNKVDNLIDDVINEYYTWYPKDHVQPAFIEGKIGTAGYMYNGYYKVFTETTKYTTYEIEKRTGAIIEDKIRIFAIGGVILTIIFICVLTPIIRRRRREEKKRNEPLFDKLKNKISPANFMSPYDDTKVEKANLLFEKLMKINPSDLDSLREVRRQAMSQLGINFISEEYLEDLRAKCNPQRFMEPYNAEKVRLANTLYNRLITNENDIEILEEIEKEVNNL
jgi:hypothetical protein